jgi:WD40 repeat protein
MPKLSVVVLGFAMIFLLGIPAQGNYAQDSGSLPANLAPITAANADNLREIYRISFHHPVYNVVAFQGDFLAIGTSEPKLYYCHLPCDNMQTYEAVGWIARLSFSSDGQWLAGAVFSLNEYNPVQLWRTEADKLLPVVVLWDQGKGRAGALDVDFSPDDTQLATGSEDGIVRIWDVATQQLAERLIGDPSDSVNSVAFSPDGNLLAAGNGILAPYYALTKGRAQIRIWDVATFPSIQIATLTGHIFYASDLIFSTDGDLLASAGGNPQASGTDNDGTVRLWDMEHLDSANQPWAILTGHTDNARSVTFTPNGGVLASSASDGTIRLWDVASRAQILVSGEDGNLSYLIYNVTFNHDGTILASSHGDGVVRLWGIPIEE